MKMSLFQPLLLRGAVNLIACDGSIAEIEIHELKNIVETEIYFSEYNYKTALDEYITEVRLIGKDSINSFLRELENAELKERQKFILLEVLIRVMESDDIIEENELKFLQLVKSKLNINDEALILKFPDKLEFLLKSESESLQTEFTEDIKFEN